MDDRTRHDFAQGATNRSSGSFELVFAAALFSVVGLLLDVAVGLVPLFTVLFAVAGFVGSAVSLYFRYNAEMRSHAEARGR